MLSKIVCSRLCYCTLPLKQIFQQDATTSRITTFSQIHPQSYFAASCLLQQYKITMPSIIKMTNGKQLREYIQQNKIQENVRILHALAHIQFNAFLAYADTAFRFTSCLRESQQMNFYEEISQIAKDQGRHFCMLSARLQELGFYYGYIPVISNLTDTILKTEDSLVSRLSAISIIHEGRGMKSISKLIHKLRKTDDLPSIPILQQIQSQQTFHFTTGRKWILTMCQQNNTKIQQMIDEVNAQISINLKLSDFKFDSI